MGIFVSINEKMGALSIGPVSLKQSMRCSLSYLVSVIFSLSECLVGMVASGVAGMLVGVGASAGVKVKLKSG